MKQNKAFLKYFRTQPCSLCGVFPSDPDHIITRGAGGKDEESNLWPLCRRHHTERHAIGLVEITRRHPHLATILISKGFELVQIGKDSRWKKGEGSWGGF